MTALSHSRSSSFVTLGAGVLLTSAALATPAFADDAEPHTLDRLWSFANVSVNYLDWSNGTEARTASNAAKSDFTYVEIEGGVGFSWGDGQVTSHIYLGDSPLSLYAHLYDFRDYGYEFREQDQILGLGYRTTFDNGLWFKPFIGAARVQSNSYTGMNGFMAGWVAGYDFTALNQNFSVTNWHEQTFGRDDEYLTQNYVGDKAGSVGTNGALSLWWHPSDLITTGVQYRYSENKLGTPDAYQNAMIYSVKLNLL